MAFLELKYGKRRGNELMKKIILIIIVTFMCLAAGCGKSESENNTVVSDELNISLNEETDDNEALQDIVERENIELTDIYWNEQESVYEVEYIDLDGNIQQGEMDINGNIDPTDEDDYQGEGVVLDCYKGRFLVKTERSSIDELYYLVQICDKDGFPLASERFETEPVYGEYGHLNEDMFWFNVFESNYPSEYMLRDTYLITTESQTVQYLGLGVEDIKFDNGNLYYKKSGSGGYGRFTVKLPLDSGEQYSEGEFSSTSGENYAGAVSSGYYTQDEGTLIKYDWEGNELWTFDRYPIIVRDVSENGICCSLSGADGNTYVTCLDKDTAEMKYEPIMIDQMASASYEEFYVWEAHPEDNDDERVWTVIDLLTGETINTVETQDKKLNDNCDGGIFVFSDTDLSDLYNFAGEKIEPKVINDLEDQDYSYLKVDMNTIEDYSANLDPDEYFCYRCSEFEFYYPANLYNFGEIYNDNAEVVAGLSEITIDLFGDESSVLSIQGYKRIDDYTTENFMQLLYEAYSDGYDNVIQISYSEENGSCYFSGYWEEYLQYNYIKIENDKVYRLFISIPIEENYSDSDLKEREYVVENIYRMCSFTESEEDTRTYEQFLSEQ